MTILEMTFDEATKGILLVQERDDLDNLKANNVTLKSEKQALQETIAATNAERYLPRYSGGKTTTCRRGKRSFAEYHCLSPTSDRQIERTS